MTTSLRAQPNLSMAGNWGKQYLIKYLFYFITLQCSGKQQYLGPYEVFYRTEKGNYYVNELDGTKIRGRIAAFRVYPYISRRHSFMRENQEEETENNSSDSESDQDSDGSN